MRGESLERGAWWGGGGGVDLNPSPKPPSPIVFPYGILNSVSVAWRIGWMGTCRIQRSPTASAVTKDWLPPVRGLDSMVFLATEEVMIAVGSNRSTASIYV